MKKPLFIVFTFSLLFIGYLLGNHHKTDIPQGVILNSGPGLKRIQSVTDEFLNAWNGKDFETCATTYAKDAVFMSPGVPVIHGREAVKQFFVDFRTTDTRQMKITEEVKEVIYFDDWAVMRGTGLFTIHNPGSPTDEIPFKWAMLSKRNAQGQWESVWDILNDDI